MTPQEQDMINGLIDRVAKTQLPEKDGDAERLLQGGLGNNPDALYILSQTVLVQQYALDQAKAQIADAKSQIADAKSQIGKLQADTQHAKPATSFLGSLFGSGSSETPAPPPRPAASNQQPVQYAPVPGYTPQAGFPTSQGYAQPQAYSAPQGPGVSQTSSVFGGGGFLRGAAQTAAGVAAGALAFEGIESLMHGFGGHSGGGYGGSGYGDGGRPEVVNNYYGDDAGGRDSQDRSNFLGDDSSRSGNDPGSNLFTGSNDRSSFAGDAGSSDVSDDNSFTNTDDADSDDSSFGGGSDDSSNDDSFADDSSDSSTDDTF